MYIECGGLIGSLYITETSTKIGYASNVAEEE
jgi:hypothetical protein